MKNLHPMRDSEITLCGSVPSLINPRNEYARRNRHVKYSEKRNRHMKSSTVACRITHALLLDYGREGRSLQLNHL